MAFAEIAARAWELITGCFLLAMLVGIIDLALCDTSSDTLDDEVAAFDPDQRRDARITDEQKAFVK